MTDDLAARFRALWDEIAPVGRDADSGGYLRYALTEPELRAARAGSGRRPQRP